MKQWMVVWIVLLVAANVSYGQLYEGRYGHHVTVSYDLEDIKIETGEAIAGGAYTPGNNGGIISAEAYLDGNEGSGTAYSQATLEILHHWHWIPTVDDDPPPVINGIAWTAVLNYDAKSEADADVGFDYDSTAMAIVTVGNGEYVSVASNAIADNLGATEFVANTGDSDNVVFTDLDYDTPIEDDMLPYIKAWHGGDGYTLLQSERDTNNVRVGGQDIYLKFNVTVYAAAGGNDGNEDSEAWATALVLLETTARLDLTVEIPLPAPLNPIVMLSFVDKPNYVSTDLVIENEQEEEEEQSYCGPHCPLIKPDIVYTWPYVLFVDDDPENDIEHWRVRPNEYSYFCEELFCTYCEICDDWY